MFFIYWSSPQFADTFSKRPRVSRSTYSAISHDSQNWLLSLKNCHNFIGEGQPSDYRWAPSTRHKKLVSSNHY